MSWGKPPVRDPRQGDFNKDELAKALFEAWFNHDDSTQSVWIHVANKAREMLAKGQ